MKRILLSTIVAGLMFSSYGIAKDSSVEEIKKETVKNYKKENKDFKPVAEAIDAIKLTDKAYQAMKENKTKEAKDYIELALGKLEVLLADEKSPKLLPINSKLYVNEFIGGPKDIELVVLLAEKELKENKIQLVRKRLQPLSSEIDFITLNLPLATYPTALKLAGKHISDGKLEEAKKVLELAMSSFVTVVEITPIPLLKAGNLMIEAEDEVKEGNKEKAKEYVTAAKRELTIAEKLGYVSKSDTTYKILKENIDEIKNKIDDEKTKGLFENFKKKIKEFKEKITSEK